MNLGESHVFLPSDPTGRPERTLWPGSNLSPVRFVVFANQQTRTRARPRSLVATMDEAGTARLWDCETGHLWRRLAGAAAVGRFAVAAGRYAGPEGVVCMAFSADDRWFVVANTSGRVRVWDLDGQSTEPVSKFSGSPVLGLAVVGESGEERLASVDRAGHVELRDLTGRLVGRSVFAHRDPMCTAFAADGSLVAISNAHRIAIVDTRTLSPHGRGLATRSGGALAVASDLAHLATALPGGRQVYVWDIVHETEKVVHLLPAPKVVASVCIAPDASGVVALLDDGEVQAWQLGLPGGRPSSPKSLCEAWAGAMAVAVAPDLAYVAIGKQDGSTSLVELPQIPRPAPPTSLSATAAERSGPGLSAAVPVSMSTSGLCTVDLSYHPSLAVSGLTTVAPRSPSMADSGLLTVASAASLPREALLPVEASSPSELFQSAVSRLPSAASSEAFIPPDEFAPSPPSRGEGSLEGSEAAPLRESWELRVRDSLRNPGALPLQGFVQPTRVAWLALRGQLPRELSFEQFEQCYEREVNEL